MKKMIKKYSLILGIAWLFIPNESLFAQFSLSGELRPRAEYRAQPYQCQLQTRQYPLWYESAGCACLGRFAATCKGW